MQLWQVIDLWRHLGQLDHGLILNNLLRHGGRVGIRHRDDVHCVVVRLLGFAWAFFWIVCVLFWCVVADDVAQQTQLLLERVVDACLDRSHHLQGTFQNRQGCTDR